MASLLFVIKHIVLLTLPLYAVHWYLTKCYGVGARTVIQWWMNNWGGLEHPGVAITFTFLGLMFVVLISAGALNTAYLWAFGENHTLVYLGNESKGIGRYVSYDSPNDDALTTAVDSLYTLSFSPIYRTEVFRKDPGHHSAGIRVKNYRFGYLLSMSLALFAFSLFLICMLHIFAHPVSTALASGAGHAEMASVDNLNAYLKRWNLGMGKVLALGFAALTVGPIVTQAVGGAERGDRAYPLPNAIAPGNTVMATPVDIDIHKEQRRRRSSDGDSDYELVDTGYRYVIFQFTNAFEFPVFVASRYHRADYPERYDQIRSYIEQRRPMPVKINEDLTITLESS